MERRQFIGAGLGLGAWGASLVRAQAPQASQAPAAEDSAFLASLPGRRPPAGPVPSRKGRIVKLFKSPEGYPNAMAAAPEGWWLAEQKTDHAVLVDGNGKLLKTVKTESKNTSGMGVGGGYIWMGANAAPQGIYQTDMDSKTVTHRQIPLGGGGLHGVMYVDGKLWIAALRLRGILRVDAKTWEPEFMIPYAVPRAHGVAWDNGTIWMVTGSDEGSGLIRYEAATGRPLETVQFPERFPDPHGLAVKDGVLYTCDAGIHPGWRDEISTATGYVCRIELR
jgi:sugar lactone lactonase YvrE